MVPVAEASHLAPQWRTIWHPGSIRGIPQVSFLPATSLTRARGVLLPCVPWREFRSGEPPKSRIRVGFGFRVLLIETNFRCRFRVSGFGFRRLKPTFAVGFGFRVFSGFGFRVSIGPGEVKSSESVSGFGFRVSIGPGEGKSSESVSGFRVSGFGFRSVLGKLSLQSRFRVSGFAVRNQL